MITAPVATEERIATLRGAGVNEIDARRLKGVVAGLCLATLAALSIAFFVVGAHRNAQISSLRQDGVPVEVHVTSCLGQLGGSGSNPVGYACRGSYTVGGHRYDEAIPGDTLRAPGSTVSAVVARDDPQLLATAGQVASEQPSARVYILPTVLAGAFVVLAGAMALRWRRSARRRSGDTAVTGGMTTTTAVAGSPGTG